MLGDRRFYIRKSKQEIADEDARYAKWAFPHGDEQRAKLEKLLLEVFPKESLATALIPYLTCKELYEKELEEQGDVDRAVNYMLNVRKKYKLIVTKKMMPALLALVVADAELNSEEIEYPTKEEILVKTAEYENRRVDTK
ncbi:MAG: hypothetical protein LBN30_07745 [Oscillospiraceae bacterium]|jgi:hypothetical protein|nr:hypothetical protein [Oscillospiraceae bacterium]